MASKPSCDRRISFTGCAASLCASLPFRVHPSLDLSFCLASLPRGLRFTLFTRLHVYPSFRLSYFCILRGLRFLSVFFGLLRLHYGLPRMHLFVFSAFSFLSFFLVLDLSRCCCVLLGLFSFGVSYLVGLVSASVLSWTVSVGVSSFQCVVSFLGLFLLAVLGV